MVTLLTSMLLYVLIVRYQTETLAGILTVLRSFVVFLIVTSLVIFVYEYAASFPPAYI
jgi:glucan phosphoethanolaminetransferase (alkaline phosphatase superfamily)